MCVNFTSTEPTSLLQRVYEHLSMGIRLMTGSALQSYSQWRSRRKLKEGAEDAKESRIGVQPP